MTLAEITALAAATIVWEYLALVGGSDCHCEERSDAAISCQSGTNVRASRLEIAASLRSSQ